MAAVAALIIALTTHAAMARDRPDRDPETVTEGVIATIIDADTVVLKSGVEIRLVGIQAPKLPLGRRGFRSWPLADTAKQFVETLTGGKSVKLSYGGRKIDRHRRLLAHLFLQDGTWVQGEILKAGWARVYSFPDNRSRVPEMLALEQQARLNGKGIWRHKFYALRSAENSAHYIGSFQLIEGTPTNVAIVRNRAYLNFGENWRTDFTITMSPKVMRRFWRGDDMKSKFENRRLRVRGWLKKFNGPQIEVSHPEQIEVLP